MGFLATIGTAKLLFVRMTLRERIRNILPHGRKRSTAQFQIVQLLGQSIAAVLLTGGAPRTHPQCDHDGIWNRKISDEQDGEFRSHHSRHSAKTDAIR